MKEVEGLAPEERALFEAFLQAIRRAPAHGRVEVRAVAVLQDGKLTPECVVEPARIRPLAPPARS